MTKGKGLIFPKKVEVAVISNGTRDIPHGGEKVQNLGEGARGPQMGQIFIEVIIICKIKRVNS